MVKQVFDSTHIQNNFPFSTPSDLLGSAMSPTAACVVVVLTLCSASTSAVGSSDAIADASASVAAKSTGPPPVVEGLTIVQRIQADHALSTCDVYPLRSLIASKALNEEFLQCTDIAVPDGDSVVFSDGEKDAVVPFCLANFFSLEVLCKAPKSKSKKPLFKDVNDFKASVDFCNKLESTLVLFDCEAVKAKVPEASVARCDAFNRARESLFKNCPKVSYRLKYIIIYFHGCIQPVSSLVLWRYYI